MLSEGEDIPGAQRDLPTPAGAVAIMGTSTQGSTALAPEAPGPAGVGALLEQWLLPERALPQPP